MSAIIRVKRRNSDEPQDALLIACKKCKIHDNETIDSKPLITVAKLTGTVNTQNEDVLENVIKNISKEDLEKNFKKHNVDILTKSRETARLNSKQNRYKIINYYRSLTDKENKSDQDVTTIIDIEDFKSTNKINKEEEKYVYDIYYTDPGDDMLLEQMISVYPAEHDFVFDNENISDEENIVDSDDENSESNWRNDYPDESDDNDDSINEDDMIMAVENMKMGENLSSDEEDFAYGLNEDDVNNYGFSFAKYKARVMKEMGDNSQSDKSDECDCDYKYDDNSDEDNDIDDNE